MGQIIGAGKTEGAAMKRQFLDANPKLKILINNVQAKAKKGWLRAIDGRRVRIRRDKKTKQLQIYKAPNTLLQSAGAIAMKYSMVWLDQEVRKAGLDAVKVIDMHDEGQSEVHPDDVEEYSALARQSLIFAGEYLNLRCPLDADVMVATRWSDTH